MKLDLTLLGIAWLLLAPPGHAENLLANGDFDAGRGLASWRVARRHGSPEARPRRDDSPRGGCAELAVASVGEEVGLLQEVPARPGRFYRLSFFLCTEIQGGEAMVEARFRGEGGRGRQSRELVVVDRTCGWCRQVAYLHVPPAADSVQIVLGLAQKAPGKSLVRFDGVTLEATGEPPPIRHVDAVAARAVSDREQERGFTLFGRHWLDLVFPDSFPRAGSDPAGDPPLSAAAAPGEYEPVTFAIRALADLQEVFAEATDLVSPAGARIPPECIVFSRVQCLAKRTLADGAERYDAYPSYLETLRREDLPAQTTRWLWLTLRIPDGADAGTYTGSVRVTVGGVPRAELRLDVRVHGFHLPPPAARYAMTLPGSWLGGRAGKAEFAAAFRDLKEHGVDSVGIWFGPLLSEIRRDGDRVCFEFAESSRYFACMEALKEARLGGEVMLGADSAQAFAAVETLPLPPEQRRRLLEEGHQTGVWKQLGGKLPDFTPEFRALYCAGVGALREAHRERGWPDFLLGPRDEPFYGDEEVQREADQLLEFLGDVAGLRRFVLGRHTEGAVTRFGPRVETFAFAGGVLGRTAVESLRREGKTVMIYNVDTRGVFPETVRYAVGYYLWANDLQGLGTWQYQGVFGSAYDDQDGLVADQIYRYPPEGDRAGGPALAWEAHREGIDDHCYLLALSTALAEARASGNEEQCREADRVMRELEARRGRLVHLPDLRFTAARWEEVRIAENGEKECVGKLELPNGWTFEEYDEMRRWAATETEKLLARHR